MKGLKSAIFSIAAMAVLLLAPSVGASEAVPTATPGERTIKNLLLTAVQPIGKTLYVWGGGWNEADTGAGTPAVTIGVSPRWGEYFASQNRNYNYRNTRYQIYDGLDCSGYIGWCVYNVMNTESGKEGYVMKAGEMAANFAGRGWGSFTASGKVTDFKAGDIMSLPGSHVYMVVGSCADGSIVLAHASPPCVRLAGTPAPNGKAESMAVRLAREYSQKYWPELYERYPAVGVSTSYLNSYNQFRWSFETMADPDNYRNMSAEEILEDMFAPGEMLEPIPFELYINENKVDNLRLRYPLMFGRNVIYFPCTYENCLMLGLRVNFPGSTALYLDDSAKAYPKLDSAKKAEKIRAASLNSNVYIRGNLYYDHEWPPLIYRDIVYLPLTWEVIQLLRPTVYFDGALHINAAY
ncbi:MAG: hypothetical protein J1F63_00565 [Oscillospiraceae bacterium]|nr:hypothetical protein [Oscillospiraceae bacterium]